MASRAANRLGTGSNGPNRLHLPTCNRPQIVNEDGYEVNEVEAALRSSHNGGGVEGRREDEMMDEPGAITTQGEAFEERQELLGVADRYVSCRLSLHPNVPRLLSSLVFTQSLAQTRQRHMHQLFPHVFSHPAIASHNKPRARPIPRNTFLFPTPPAPTQPLPNPEYHGPVRPLPVTPTGSTSMPGPRENATASSSTAPAAASKPIKRPTTTEPVEPAAHEMECIARVTLSVGPCSYPGTELWIGKFVYPRQTMTGTGKREKGKARAEKDARQERRASMIPPRTVVPNINSTPYGPPRPPALGPPSTTSSGPPLGQSAASDLSFVSRSDIVRMQQ
jgi:hypothetical protein